MSRGGLPSASACRAAEPLAISARPWRMDTLARSIAPASWPIIARWYSS